MHVFDGSRFRPRFCRSLVLGGLLSSLFLPATFAQGTSDLDPAVAQQIGQLLQEKESRTPVQRKISSRLIYALKADRGEPVMAAGQNLPGIAQAGASGSAVVEIEGTISSELITSIQQAGGQVLFSSPQYDVVRARMPLQSLEGLASRSDVRTVRTPSRARTNRAITRPEPGAVMPSIVRLPPAKQARLARHEQGPFPLLAMAGALQRLRLSFFAGSLLSQGDIAHGSNLARQQFGVDGTGVKIGVLSDSALPGAVASLVASGDLPANTVVLPGQAGPLDGANEGAAMMEIIHDIVPGAQLFFATAFNSEQGFADNIRALRDVGCQFIVDDVGYGDEPVFQDGLLARAINDVTATGVLYFSAAGNDNNLTSGTSGTWEGDFVAGPVSTAPLPSGYTLHQFTAARAYNVVNSSPFIRIFWSDPLGGSSNDYDAFLLNAAGTSVIDSSTNIQAGTGDAFEYLGDIVAIPNGARIVIAKKASAAVRALHLDTLGGVLQTATSGATFGHNAAANAVDVAAVFWNSARRGTRPFVGGVANPTEIFSSDGPRRIFFNPNGTAVTPGNFLFSTNGGIALIKPDLSAADGVTTRTEGFNPFYGTSAAAPHAVALAALVKSARPSLTGPQILQILKQTALDIRAVGIDRDAGYGIIMALPAVQAALSQ